MGPIGRLPLFAVAAVLGIAVLAWLSARRPSGDRSDAAPSAAVVREEAPPPERSAPDLPAEVPAPDVAESEAAPLDADAIGQAVAWDAIDLEQVRAALPDNVYWTRAAPTTDPTVIEARAEAMRQWNVHYGKVLSGTATEEEIRAFYDERARVSGDYVELTTYLIDHYGETLSGDDQTLLHLARRLHRARLEEIPRKIEEAFEHKRAQDAARAAWLADEKRFNE